MNVNALRELMNFYDSEGLGGPPAQRSNFDGMFGGMDGDPNRSSRRMMFAERMLNNDARRSNAAPQNFFPEQEQQSQQMPAYVQPQMTEFAQRPPANFFTRMRGAR